MSRNNLQVFVRV